MRTRWWSRTPQARTHAVAPSTAAPAARLVQPAACTRHLGRPPKCCRASRRAVSSRQRQTRGSPAGRYSRYKQQVGSGRFKNVFKGFDERQGIDVAWSKIEAEPNNLTHDQMKKIVEDISYGLGLDHPHVIKARAAGRALRCARNRAVAPAWWLPEPAHGDRHRPVSRLPTPPPRPCCSASSAGRTASAAAST